MTLPQTEPLEADVTDRPKSIRVPVTPEMEAMRQRGQSAPRLTAPGLQPAYVLTIEGRSDDAVPQALIDGKWVDVEDVRFRLGDMGHGPHR